MTSRNAAALILVAGLGSLSACGSSPKPEPDPKTEWLPDAMGAPIELGTSAELLEIAQLEYERSAGDGRLVELLSNSDPRVRKRAALALGRLPFPEFGAEVTDPLCRVGLEDPDPEIRHMAAFALGLRADPRSLGVLEAYRNDVDPELRARVVEAASRIANTEVQQDLLLALRDSDLGVRIEAAVATAHFDQEAPNADDVNRALLDTLRPYTIAPDRTARTAVEAELVWRILYALSRRNAELGRGAFLEYADSDVPLEQLFALRGLARIGGDAETVDAASRVLTGDEPTKDWRVAYEATSALGRAADPAGLPALEAAAEHSSVHVRAGAMTALGNLKRSKASAKLLNRGLVDLSPSVRDAALESMVATFPADDAIERLASFARDNEVMIRVGAARAGANLDDPRAAEILRGLAFDKNTLVATSAIESLGAHQDAESRALLHQALGHQDNGIRLAAVLALRRHPDAADFEPLVRAFQTSEGDVSNEVDFNVLRNLGKIGGDQARAFVRQAAGDDRVHVRRVAKEVLAEDFGVAVEIAPPTSVDRGPVPFPGRDFPDWDHNPLVEITTSKGKLAFELFPAEAPVHVHNFLVLAERGEYDGLIFHRVVPDFVVQGGDYRGDGNGGRPWHGDSVPHEFGPRKYTRGSLGMPRNEDVDSGGSQFFVTHRPTPHLDGRYTIFGELRAGGTVLDRIEMSDRILGVRLIR